MKLRLDASSRLVDDDAVLIGGSPLAIFRLTAGGSRIVRAIADEHDLPKGHERLTDRLLDAGAVHPVIDSTTPPPLLTAAIVIPSFGRPPDVGWTLDRQGEIRIEQVVVVDDASVTPIGPIDGVRVIRRDVNGGAGSARNTGAAASESDLIVFVDSDCAPSGSWLSPLAAHFADQRVGLVAARVVSLPGTSQRDRYEMWRTPIDLGPTPGRVRAGTRISYVPAAVIVVRRTAFEAVGGFDEGLRYGEDVDLGWRLDEAGWRCRYEPAVVVGHHPRASWATWWSQRVGYGSSAAPLALRHPTALAPARVSGWSAAVWAAVVAGHPLVGIGIAAGTTAALARKLTMLRHPWREALNLAGRGHLNAGRILAYAVTRAWWPLSVAAALLSRRARRAVLAAAVVPPLLDWWAQRPLIDPASAVVLRAADDVAYGTGVWQGVIRHRTIRPLIPDLASWPGRRAAATSTTD